jgi:uncharacterized surface protein with fasciclin (FAS1) repeats
MVSLADVGADNGVAHIIDTVLLPGSTTTGTSTTATTATATATTTTTLSTVLEVLKSRPSHATLLDLVSRAPPAVTSLLSQNGVTLFAPLDTAFETLPDGSLACLLADGAAKLVEVLKFHTIASTVVSSMLTNGMNAMTVQGTDLQFIEQYPGHFTVGDAAAENDPADIVLADLMATNGVVHVVDKVMFPAGFEVCAETTTGPSSTDPTIAELVQSVSEFGYLMLKLRDAGLMETLDANDRNFTVLAPTTAAFENLPLNLRLELASNKALLTEILLYHVLDGVIDLSAQVETKLTTLSSDYVVPRMSVRDGADELVVSNNDGVVTAVVIGATSVAASNGVVYSIDTVLIPSKYVTSTTTTTTVTATTTTTVPPSTTTIVPTTVTTQPATMTSTAPAITTLELLQASNLLVIFSDLVAADPQILALLTADSTIFAPTDGAFAAMDPCLLANGGAAVTALLKAHIVTGLALSTDLTDGGTFDAQGNTVVSRKGSRGGWQVSNSDGTVTAKIVKADLKSANGVVHIIDSLLPPADFVPCKASTTPAVPAIPTIGSLLRTTSELGYLMLKIRDLDLMNAMDDATATYTVFAPTTEAFEQLGDDLRRRLLSDPVLLREIILYHVVEGRVLVTDRTVTGEMIEHEMAYATMNDGQEIKASQSRGYPLGWAVQNNGADIIETAEFVGSQANIVAANGVVHLINAVMLPAKYVTTTSSTTTTTTVASTSRMPKTTVTKIPEANESKDADDDDGREGGLGLMVYVGIGAGVLVLTILVVAIVVKRSRKVKAGGIRIGGPQQTFSNPLYDMGDPYAGERGPGHLGQHDLVHGGKGHTDRQQVHYDEPTSSGAGYIDVTPSHGTYDDMSSEI